MTQTTDATLMISVTSLDDKRITIPVTEIRGLFSDRQLKEYTFITTKSGYSVCLKKAEGDVIAAMNAAVKEKVLVVDFRDDCVSGTDYHRLERKWDIAAVRRARRQKQERAVARAKEEELNERALTALLAYKKKQAAQARAEKRQEQQDSLKRTFSSIAGRVMAVFSIKGPKSGKEQPAIEPSATENAAQAPAQQGSVPQAPASSKPGQTPQTPPSPQPSQPPAP